MDWVILEIPVKKCNVGMLLMCLFDGKLCSMYMDRGSSNMWLPPSSSQDKINKNAIINFGLFYIMLSKMRSNIYCMYRPTVCPACIAWLNSIRFSLVQKVRSIYGFTINHDVFLGQEKSSAAVNGREWKILLRTLND